MVSRSRREGRPLGFPFFSIMTVGLPSCDLDLSNIVKPGSRVALRRIGPFRRCLVLPSAQTGTQISWAMSLKHRESGHIRLGRIVLGCCARGTPIGSVPLSEREVSSAKAINKFLDILTFLPVQTKVAVR